MVRVRTPSRANDANPEGMCPTYGAGSVISAEIRELTHAVQALTTELRMHGKHLALASEHKPPPASQISYRVRRVAAQVRVRVDRQGGRTTPDWIRVLAEESDDRDRSTDSLVKPSSTVLGNR